MCRVVSSHILHYPKTNSLDVIRVISENQGTGKTGDALLTLQLLMLNQKKFKNLMALSPDSTRTGNLLRARRNEADFELLILQDPSRLVYVRADYSSNWQPELENKQLHRIIEVGGESRQREVIDMCFEARRLKPGESSLVGVLARNRQEQRLELLVYSIPDEGRKGALSIRGPYRAMVLEEPASPANTIGSLAVTGMYFSADSECLLLFGQCQVDEASQVRGVMMSANPPKPKMLIVARYDCSTALNSQDSTKQYLLRPSWQYGYRIPHVASQLTGLSIPLLVTASVPVDGVSFILVAARLTNLCLVFRTHREGPGAPTLLSLVHRRPLEFDTILKYRGGTEEIEIESLSLLDTFHDLPPHPPAPGPPTSHLIATLVFNKTYLAQLSLKPITEIEF